MLRGDEFEEIILLAPLHMITVHESGFIEVIIPSFEKFEKGGLIVIDLQQGRERRG